MIYNVQLNVDDDHDDVEDVEERDNEKIPSEMEVAPPHNSLNS